MAETIRGINIVIGAETTGLSKALSDVNKKSKDIQSELRQVERLLKLDPKNTELLAQKQKLLSDAVANTREKLDSLKAAQEQVNQQFAKGEISEGQYRAFQREIAKTEQDLKKFETQLKSMEPTIESFGDKLQKAGDKIGDAGKKMTDAGKNLSMKVTAPLVGLGAAVAKTGMDFEAAMSEVGAISGATGEDMEKLEALAREMGATTKFSASEAAEGLKYMAMAGWDVQQQLDGLPGVLNLAAASGESLGTVSDIVTDAMTAFGMEAAQAGEFADILAAASSNANTNVGMLGESFKYVAPIFGSLGYSADDAALALGLMANAGIKASQAGTALRGAITRMMKPSKDAAKLIDELGLKFTDAEGNMLPFRDVMDQLRSAFANLTAEQQAQYAATIFGQEAMSGMLAIINASEGDYNKLVEAIDNSTGAADRMAKQMQDNLKGRLTELKSAIEGVALQLYDHLQPALEKIVAVVQNVVDWFANLSPWMQQTIVMIAGLAAAIGPLLIVLGMLTASLGSIISLFGGMAASSAAAATGASAGFAAILGPVGLAAAAIAGLVAVGALVAANWDTIRDKAQEVWGRIAEVIGPAVEEVVSFVKEQLGILLEWWNKVWPDLQKAFENIWNGIFAFLEPIINAIVTLFQWAWPFIRAIIAEAWRNVKNVISSTLNIIMGLVNAFAALFTGNWQGLWEAIKQILSNALELLWNIFQLWGTGKVLKFVGFLGGKLGKIFRTIWDEVAGISSSALSKLFNLVKGVFDNILSWIIGLGKRFFDAGRGLIEQIKRGIESAAAAVVSSVKNLAQNVRDFLPFSPAKTGPLSDLDKLDFGGPIATSIQRAIPRVDGMLNDLLALPDGRFNVNVSGTGGQSGSGSSVLDFEGMFAGANFYVRSDVDIQLIAKELFNLQQQAARGRGLVP